MVTLAALVLTITLVVVQLAMGQFSPRIVQTFLQDRPSQLAIGLFVATFAHAMLTLREVQFNGAGQVPGLAIVVAFVLVVDQHHRADPLRPPHRAVAAGLSADRARRQGDARACSTGLSRTASDRGVAPTRPSWPHRLRGALQRRSRATWSRSAPRAGCVLARRAGHGRLRAGRRAALPGRTATPTGLDETRVPSRCPRASNAPSTRTWPTGSACWSTSPNGLCRTRPTRIPPPPCRHRPPPRRAPPAGPPAAPRRACTATTTATVRVVLPDDGLGRLRPPRLRRAPPRRRGSPQVAPSAACRPGGPPRDRPRNPTPSPPTSAGLARQRCPAAATAAPGHPLRNGDRQPGDSDLPHLETMTASTHPPRCRLPAACFGRSLAIPCSE